jgi:uncharacterized membrane protein
MSHIENIKKLFGEFKFLNDKQTLAHQDLERVQAEIYQYPVAEPQVATSTEKLNFLKGKSAVFFREFEKLRSELNTYKNSPQPDPTVAEAFSKKLTYLEEKQKSFQQEIDELRALVKGFEGQIEKRHEDFSTDVSEPVQSQTPPVASIDQQGAHDYTRQGSQPNPEPAQEQRQQQSTQHQYTPPPPPKPKPDEHTPEGMDSAEVFVGQKIFSYVGIGILVIGLGLGTKVAIDKEWFGPLFQVIGGYAVAAALGVLGIFLKKKYEGFSVVLVGGAMASAYLMTYASYAFYGYFGQLESFVIMVILTAITVFAALKYDQELIAILGMVGAYCVPFLLDEDSGQVHIMFSYMAIINAGILFIAFKKYWRGLYYSAFGLTWLIFGSWFIMYYQPIEHFHIAITFLSIFYVTFYTAFLAHKLIQKEEFNAGDIALILVNSILFFLIGYNVLSTTIQGSEYLGMFALGNAAFHFIITMVFYQKKMAEKALFYVEAGMVLLFVTIAIPIQFDGNWIPIFWTLEAMILFFIGRFQGIKVYETLSYPMIIVAFFSVCKSLVLDYRPHLKGMNDVAENIPFVINEVFLGAILACVGFGILAIMNRAKTKRPEKPNGWQVVMDFFIPIMAFTLLYFTFFAEIWVYWQQLFDASGSAPVAVDWFNSLWDTPRALGNADILKFRAISLLDYSLVFLGALAGLNWVAWKNKNFGIILTAVSMFGILLYALMGTVMFNQLAESLMHPNPNFPLTTGKVYLFKYVSLAVFVVFTIVQYLTSRGLKLGESFSQWNAGLIHLCALILISHEFLFLADVNGLSNSTKTSLSVFWAAYAVVMMAIGISKKLGYLRISAFVIIGIVLSKLLLYDLTHLALEVKTLVFISIGVLLLIVSFLYYRVVAKQKQKDQLAAKNAAEPREAGHQESE